MAEHTSVQGLPAIQRGYGDEDRGSPLTALASRAGYYILKRDGRHKVQVFLFACFFAAIIGWTAYHGYSYYRLDLAHRAISPLRQQFRPSGSIGIRLALLAVGCFLVIFLYALRKRWKWLSRRGKTRNWLDFHVVLGISAPILITFHSAFKMRGIAGIAYWIMIAVMLSGIIGRYLYAQIPRRINAAELSLNEMQALTDELTQELHSQSVVSADELKPLLALRSKDEIEAMSAPAALALMLVYDLRRPFLVAGIRRRFMSWTKILMTAGGLLRSRQASLEKVVDLARKWSWISAKINFLSKTHQVFHLWHVVHRPFSYSFAILAGIHIGVVVLMGYF